MGGKTVIVLNNYRFLLIINVSFFFFLIELEIEQIHVGLCNSTPLILFYLLVKSLFLQFFFHLMHAYYVSLSILDRHITAITFVPTGFRISFRSGNIS